MHFICDIIIHIQQIVIKLKSYPPKIIQIFNICCQHKIVFLFQPLAKVFIDSLQTKPITPFRIIVHEIQVDCLFSKKNTKKTDTVYSIEMKMLLALYIQKNVHEDLIK